MVVSDIDGLYGYTKSLDIKINIDNGTIPNVSYHEFYIENKKVSNGDLLIIIETGSLNFYENINIELLNTLKNIKSSLRPSNIYIVLSNLEYRSSSNQYVRRIAKAIKQVLGTLVKVFIKERLSSKHSVLVHKIFQDDRCVLEHAKEIRDACVKKYNVNLIQILYFTNSYNYNLIDDDKKYKMAISNIKFLAHSTQNDILGVTCSKKEDLNALSDCLTQSFALEHSKENEVVYHKRYKPKIIKEEEGRLPFFKIY